MIAHSPGTRGRAPKVNVVVPCHNYGHYLDQCISSITSQPDVECDILVIDDASTDGSAAVVERLAAQHKNVTAIIHSENKGHIATYNEGLRKADSDYVVLLSADDLLTPRALSRATYVLDANPSMGLIYGNPISFSDQLPAARGDLKKWSSWSGQKWIRAQYRRGLGIIYSPEAVVRTTVQHEVGYYNKDLPHSADLEMWLRIAAVGGVGHLHHVDQAYRRVHPKSMMQTNFGTVFLDLRERQRAFETALDSMHCSPKIRQQLLATAQRRTALDALDWSCDNSLLSGDAPGRALLEKQVEECIELARSLWPGMSSSKIWKEYELRRNYPMNPSTWSLLQIRTLAALRDIQGRVRWQRWYRWGL